MKAKGKSNDEIIVDMKQNGIITADINRFLKIYLNNYRDDITAQWFVSNKFHEDYWKYARMKKASHVYYEIKKVLRQSPGYKAPIAVEQKIYLSQNNLRIQSIYDQNTFYSQNDLSDIMNECQLISKLNIVNEIITIITSFVGDIIPISYTLSYLPFMEIIDDPSYYDELKKWWDQVRLSSDNCGLFYPGNIKTAAVEFNNFIQDKLAHNGKREIVYRWRTKTKVPTITIKLNKSFSDLNISDNDATISLKLPTSLSKCIGGIELFQRLYLESYIERADHGFNIDISHIKETANDGFCFDANCNVLMANGKYNKICNLKIGDKVRSFPNCVATITCVIISNVKKQIKMVKLNNECWITFEHPILINNNLNINNYDQYEKVINNLNSYDINKYGLYWVLPKDIYSTCLRYQDKVYNFILNKHHTLNVNGNWCITLGHNYKGDVIQHEFWGNSEVIKSYLVSRSSTYPNVYLSSGFSSVV